MFLKHPDPPNPPVFKNDDLPPPLFLNHPVPTFLAERHDDSSFSLDEKSCSDIDEYENHLCLPASKTRLRHLEQKNAMKTKTKQHVNTRKRTNFNSSFQEAPLPQVFLPHQVSREMPPAC